MVVKELKEYLENLEKEGKGHYILMTAQGWLKKENIVNEVDDFTGKDMEAISFN